MHVGPVELAPVVAACACWLLSPGHGREAHTDYRNQNTGVFHDSPPGNEFGQRLWEFIRCREWLKRELLSEARDDLIITFFRTLTREGLPEQSNNLVPIYRIRLRLREEALPAIRCERINSGIARLETTENVTHAVGGEKIA
jgi:hypothetical protein